MVHQTPVRLGAQERHTEAEPSAADVLLWTWQPPEDVAENREPDSRWRNDNDRFPSAVRALRGHLARHDWNGWRIIAWLRDGQKITLVRPALPTSAEPTDAAKPSHQLSAGEEP
jgi:hypothetical protein